MGLIVLDFALCHRPDRQRVQDCLNAGRAGSTMVTVVESAQRPAATSPMVLEGRFFAATTVAHWLITSSPDETLSGSVAYGSSDSELTAVIERYHGAATRLKTVARNAEHTAAPAKEALEEVLGAKTAVERVAAQVAERVDPQRPAHWPASCYFLLGFNDQGGAAGAALAALSDALRALYPELESPAGYYSHAARLAVER